MNQENFDKGICDCGGAMFTLTHPEYGSSLKCDSCKLQIKLRPANQVAKINRIATILAGRTISDAADMAMGSYDGDGPYDEDQYDDGGLYYWGNEYQSPMGGQRDRDPGSSYTEPSCRCCSCYFNIGPPGCSGRGCRNCGRCF